MHKLPILSSIIGLILGSITAVTFLNPAQYALPLWAVIGIIICFLTTDKKQLLVTGALYGFFTSFSFLVFDFHGKSSEFISYLPVLLLLSIVGGLFAVILFAVTKLVRSFVLKKSNKL